MTTATAQTGRTVLQEKRSKRASGKSLLAELRQMSRITMREEGLLNHAQAAIVLDVSTRRVGELVELGHFTRFDFLGRTYVSLREVLVRREADVKAGRPRKTMMRRIADTAKTVAKYDPVQGVVAAITPEPKKRPKK